MKKEFKSALFVAGLVTIGCIGVITTHTSVSASALKPITNYKTVKNYVYLPWNGWYSGKMYTSKNLNKAIDIGEDIYIGKNRPKEQWKVIGSKYITKKIGKTNHKFYYVKHMKKMPGKKKWTTANKGWVDFTKDSSYLLRVYPKSQQDKDYKFAKNLVNQLHASKAKTNITKATNKLSKKRLYVKKRNKPFIGDIYDSLSGGTYSWNKSAVAVGKQSNASLYAQTRVMQGNLKFSKDMKAEYKRLTANHYKKLSPKMAAGDAWTAFSVVKKSSDLRNLVLNGSEAVDTLSSFLNGNGRVTSFITAMMSTDQAMSIYDMTRDTTAARLAFIYAINKNPKMAPNDWLEAAQTEQIYNHYRHRLGPEELSSLEFYMNDLKKTELTYLFGGDLDTQMGLGKWDEWDKPGYLYDVISKMVGPELEIAQTEDKYLEKYLSVDSIDIEAKLTIDCVVPYMDNLNSFIQ
ncbi:hypothetical protein [Lactiplantibacillus daowaiensis]|uniref:D-alanyl-D-alanine carboxypeptidase n=1 Tax=Lactiplantibacillus daowaiensis TaxID=2559918 RepID=A0ABW1RX63_9LACO|nr:hypothetical protein [Lactiplantibacillus daowaiensis]